MLFHGLLAKGACSKQHWIMFNWFCCIINMYLVVYSVVRLMLMIDFMSVQPNDLFGVFLAQTKGFWWSKYVLLQKDLLCPVGDNVIRCWQNGFHTILMDGLKHETWEIKAEEDRKIRDNVHWGICRIVHPQRRACSFLAFWCLLALLFFTGY